MQSLWLNAGAQITHGGQVQRPRQKRRRDHAPYTGKIYLFTIYCCVLTPEVDEKKTKLSGMCERCLLKIPAQSSVQTARKRGYIHWTNLAIRTNQMQSRLHVQ